MMTATMTKGRISSVSAAYLQHLQEKQHTTPSSSGTPTKTCKSPLAAERSTDGDHRQTIVSPLAKERVVVAARTNSNTPTLPSISGNGRTTGAFKRGESPPASTPTSVCPSSIVRSERMKKQQQTKSARKGKKKNSTLSTNPKKPPLGCKLSRSSVISESTNSTYLSSDSEGEETTSIHSDTQQSTGSGGITARKLAKDSSTRKPRINTDVDRNNNSHQPASRTASAPTDAPRALVPYESTVVSSSSTTSGPLTPASVDNDERDEDSLVEQEQGLLQYSDNEDDGLFGGDDDSLIVDLDELIQESSNRWKQTTLETVQNTVTAKSRSQYLLSVLDSNNNSSSSLQTGKRSSSGSSASAASSATDLLIEEQQAEIEALRAKLQAQHVNVASATTTGSPVAAAAAVSSSPADHHEHRHHEEVPIPQIEVMTTDQDQGLYGAPTDDLTVWSGFQSTVQRPDAASVVSTPPQAQKTIKLANGVVFTGTTMTSFDEDETITERDDGDDQQDRIIITGVGILQFPNHNVYRGAVVENEMHGDGCFTNFKTGETLKGRFEHNVYVDY